MNKGYSLLETVIVLALLSLILYGASAAFLGRAPRHQLNRAAWEVNAQLNYARHKAIFEGRPFRVTFRPSGYVIEEFDSVLKAWRPEANGACEGVSIDANNTPIFHPAGTVSNMATITISNTAGRFRITLAISGRIRVVRI